MASYVLLAALVIGTLWIFLTTFLSQNLERDAHLNLLREAQVAAHILETRAPTGPAIDALADDLAVRFEARVSIFTHDGELIGDSELTPSQLSATSLHLDAKRLKAIQRSPYSDVWTDEDAESMHAVVALPEHGQRIRMSVPIATVRSPLRTLWTTLLAGAVVAVVVAGILGFIASRFFTRPLTELGSVALAMAGGDFTRRVDYPVADELGLLGDSLDYLSSELSEKLRLLTEEKTRLGTILRSMSEGVVVVEAGGGILLVNPALRQMFDLPSNIDGKPIDEVAPDLAEALRSGLSRPDANTEELVIQKGNFRFDIRVSVAPLSTPGQLPAVAVLSDISQVRRLERIRRDFVANVSHELRTPLTAVRGYAETLLDTGMDIPDMAVEFIETILRHTVRLSRLIDDLLTLASIEGRGLDSRLRAVDVYEAVFDAVDVLKHLASERDLQILVDIPEDLPPAHAEDRALRHVLSNLLENAVKYTPETGKVSIRARAEGAHVILDISDTGIGIDAVHLPRIFERFYRVDEGRSREVGGSGLGLALVKHLVSTLGGTIEATSEGLGEGTTFTLKLTALQGDSSS